MKEEDIGIKYCRNFIENKNNYIKYLGISEKGQYIFIEENKYVYKIDYDYNLDIVEIKKIKIDNQVDYYVESKNGAYYYSKSDNSIYKYEEQLKKRCLRKSFYSLESDEKLIHLKVVNNNIIFSTTKLRLVFLSLETFNVDKIIYLDKNFFIEPFWFEILDERILLVDASANCVHEISFSGEILWTYGKYDDPGYENNRLFIPVSAMKYKNEYIISEQRGHRIISVSKNKEILKIYGNTSKVGNLKYGFWAPSIMGYYGDKILIAQCKGSNLNIILLNTKTGKTKSVYGNSIIESSIFNFPRVIAWSKKYKLLAIADSGNNEIKIMKNNKVLTVLTKFNGKGLQFPRYVSWNDEKLLITDSKNRRLIYYDYQLKEYIEFSSELFNNNFDKKDWLQSAILKDNYLLVSSSNKFVVYSIENYNLIFDSSLVNYKFKDIHSVSFSSLTKFLVADTGNNSVVEVNIDKSFKVIKNVNLNGHHIKLKKPRYFCKEFNKYLIVDSGNSKVYIIDNINDMNVLSCIGEKRGLGYKRFSLPRCACFKDDKNIFISDTDNHRIVLRNI